MIFLEMQVSLHGASTTQSYDLMCIVPKRSLLKTVIPGWLWRGMTPEGGKQKIAICGKTLTMVTYITSKRQHKWERESVYLVKLPKIVHTRVEAGTLSVVKTHFSVRGLVGKTAWSELIRHPLVSYCLYFILSKI